jgi:hypothetical protein
LFGDLIRQSATVAGRDRDAEAQSWLLGAQDCARSRKLHSLELRAATSLADLWHSQGRTTEAIEVLEPAYRSIVEGLGTHDVVKAGGLLETLRRNRVLH